MTQKSLDDPTWASRLSSELDNRDPTKLHLLVIPEYFFGEGAVKYFITAAQIFGRFFPLKWFFVQERHDAVKYIRFWRELVNVSKKVPSLDPMN